MPKAQARVFRHLESGIADDDTDIQIFDLFELDSGRIKMLDVFQSDSGDTCRVTLGFMNHGVGEFFPTETTGWVRSRRNFPDHLTWDGDWPVPKEGTTVLRLAVYNASGTAVAVFVRMIYES